MSERFVFFNIITPQWRNRFRSRTVAGLGGRRRWFRWQVVKTTRPVVLDSGIIRSAAEHHSLHWTHRSAWKTAADEQRKERARRAGATS